MQLLKKLSIAFLLASLMLSFSATAADAVVTDDISADVTWTADNVYFLNGLVFVDSLATLTIEAGTVVKGMEQDNITSGDGASALIVRRGAQLIAEGTADMPVIFTNEYDDIDDTEDYGPTDRGLWGGVILLGAASTNQPSNNNQIEGIPVEENARYGGTNDADNSGILRYVSIRHGGFSISGVPGDEINGLTMGAVGSGTTIENVEVFANDDDGFEWFGGTVNTKNLVAAFCRDDSYDYDQGCRGKHQFWFSIQYTDECGRAGEHDGGDDDETGTPYSQPEIWNVTYIGAGSAASPAGDGNDKCFAIRDNAGGHYANSIFTGFQGYGLDIEDIDIEDSRQKLEDGLLTFTDNIWYDFGAGNTVEAIVPDAWVRESASFIGNTVEDPMLESIGYAQDNGLNPVPAAGSPAATAATLPADAFFTQAQYKGAFDPAADALWTNGWTALSQDGYTGETAGDDVIVTDDITTPATWLAKNTYFLNGLVFVDSLATLTIEAGTVVKGMEQDNITSGDGASALIVRRGAQLIAEGTADMPVIFTNEYDDIDDTEDYGPTDRGLWGGVILLGAASTNQPSNNNQIEGIPVEENARYGGTNDADNSGILRYVSIRHGGFSISGVPGDEINGLTMGAVGSGTTIENVEVFANDDDGFEWFGGTVNTKNLVAAFCRDDSYDYDQGCRGKHQFWFSIQYTDECGRAGEHDGGDDDETGTPYSQPEIWNVTYIGAGSAASPAGDGNDKCFAIRDNAGGHYANSIFTGFQGYGLDIEDIDIEDSRQKLEDGLLTFTDNIWYDFGAGNTVEAIVPDAWVRESASFIGNTVEDPMLESIGYAQDNGLNPVPAAGSPAATAATLPADAFFTQAQYKGAFDPAADALWTNGWTALSQDGYTGDDATPVANDRSNAAVHSFALSQNYPNPFNPTTTINFSVANDVNVKLEVFNMLGQKVSTLVEGFRQSGKHKVTWDAANFQSGMYIYQLTAGSYVQKQKMLLLK